MEYIKDIQIDYDKLRSNEEYIEYFNNIILKYQRLDPIYAREVTLNIRQICKEEEYFVAYGYTSNLLGWNHLDKAEYKEAEEYYLEAYDYFYRFQSEKGLTKVYNSFLALYYLKGNFPLAIKNGIKGIKLAEKLNDQITLTSLMSNTANVYFEYGFYDTAIELFYDILKNERPAIPSNTVNIYMYLSYIYSSRKELKKARKNIDKAFVIIEKNDILALRGEAYLYNGIVQLAEKDIEGAYRSFKEAIDGCGEYGVANVKIEAEVRLCKLLIDSNRDVEAKKILRNLQGRLDKIESTSFKVRCCKILSDIYKSFGNLEEAFKYLQVAYSFKEEIAKVENKNWFLELKSELISNEISLYKEMYNQIENISKIGRGLISAVKLDKIYKLIYEQLGTVVKADKVTIALYDEKTKMLNYPLIFNEKMERLYKESISIENTKNMHVYSFVNNKSIFLNDIKNQISIYIQNYNIEFEDDSMNSIICIPIEIDGKTIGIIEIRKSEVDAYNYQTLTAMKLIAEYLLVAIQNANLFGRIKFVATHDGMTGILNRTQAIKLTSRVIDDEGSKSTIIIFDIDKFKKINDTYGHIRGDYVIKRTCELINRCIGNNVFARYGGEEFLIVRRKSTLEESIEFAEKIRKLVENEEFKENEDVVAIKATISLGIYQYEADCLDIYQGINRADKALYKAKKNGRNRIEVYKENL